MPPGDLRLIDGVLYEVLWDGTRGCPSLTSDGLHDSSLSNISRDPQTEDAPNGLRRHNGTLEKARLEVEALWNGDDDGD